MALPSVDSRVWSPASLRSAPVSSVSSAAAQPWQGQSLYVSWAPVPLRITITLLSIVTSCMFTSKALHTVRVQELQPACWAGLLSALMKSCHQQQNLGLDRVTSCRACAAPGLPADARAASAEDSARAASVCTAALPQRSAAASSAATTPARRAPSSSGTASRSSRSSARTWPVRFSGLWGFRGFKRSCQRPAAPAPHRAARAAARAPAPSDFQGCAVFRISRGHVSAQQLRHRIAQLRHRIAQLAQQRAHLARQISRVVGFLGFHEFMSAPSSSDTASRSSRSSARTCPVRSQGLWGF